MGGSGAVSHLPSYKHQGHFRASNPKTTNPNHQFRVAWLCFPLIGGLGWWFGGLVVWWFGGLVVWWFGGLVVWWFGGTRTGGCLTLCLQIAQRLGPEALLRLGCGSPSLRH